MPNNPKPPKRTTTAGEVISLATARLHLRLDTWGSPPYHPDDALVESLITATRESAEAVTGLAIAPGTFEMALDAFPANGIGLQLWPVASITTVTYVDEAGATQTLDAARYVLDNEQRPAALYPTEAWPRTKPSRRNAVRVTFSAGFTDGTSPNNQPTPRALVQAMLLMIGNLYENREATTEKARSEVPMAAGFLLQQHRISQGL